MKMKTIKYIIPALLSFTIWSNAQTVDQNLTVERDYKPVIQDAGKINTVPEIMNLNTEKIPANYSNFDFPLPIGLNIHTLSAAELMHQRRKTPNGTYVRVGLGSSFNNMLDFALPVINKPRTKLDLNLNHFATLGSKKHISSDAGLMFNQYFNNADVYAGINAKYEYFNYYGNNFKNHPDSTFTDFNTLKTDGIARYDEWSLVRVNRTAQTFNLDEITNEPKNERLLRFNTFVGVRSLPNTENTRYHAELGFQSFDARNGLTENNIHTQFGLNTSEAKNRLGIDLDMQNMIYKSDIAMPASNVWDAYTVFSMNPYYSFERTRWNIRLGVKSSFSFVHGKPFNPSPDISAEWKAVPKWLSIYAGASGGYSVNTLDKMYSENRWLYSDLRVKDTYTPINGYFGLKVKPVYNLLFDTYISYQYIDDQYFFINKDYKYNLTSATPLGHFSEDMIFTNRFNVLYSDATLTKVGVRANYNMRNFLNVELKGAWNGWKTATTEIAWNKPKWEAALSTNLRITRNLNLSANAFVESERYAKFDNYKLRMRPKVDINLGASYSYLNWLSMFVKVNNLINNKYEEFSGYEVQGFNVMAGAAFSF
jgi:hypothetical protein